MGEVPKSLFYSCSCHLMGSLLPGRQLAREKPEKLDLFSDPQHHSQPPQGPFAADEIWMKLLLLVSYDIAEANFCAHLILLFSVSLMPLSPLYRWNTSKNIT